MLFDLAWDVGIAICAALIAKGIIWIAREIAG